MGLLYLLETDFKRMFLSKKMLFCVLGVTGIMLFGISGWLNADDAIWMLARNSIQGNGNDSVILYMLPVFPFALSYAREKNKFACRYWIIRCGVNRYAFSKIVVSAMGGFLVVFLGICLFTVILLPNHVVYEYSLGEVAYESLLEQGYFAVGILLFATHYGMSGMISAICAMWFSTLIPNVFASAAAPLILNFTICRVFSRIQFYPEYLDPIYLASGVYVADTVACTFLVKLVTTLVVCLLFWILVRVNIGRGLRHE